MFREFSWAIGFVALPVFLEAFPETAFAAETTGPRAVVVAARVVPPTDQQAGVPLQPEFWKPADIQHVAHSAPGRHTPPGKTQFAVVHDGEYLFVAIRVTGIKPDTLVAKSMPAKPAGTAPPPPEPDLSDEDHVRIILSPLNSTEYAFEARINPLGAIQSIMRTPENPDGVRWESLRAGPRAKDKWQPPPSAGRITDDGYEVVLRLLRKRCFHPDWYRERIEPGESWAINVGRSSPGDDTSPRTVGWSGTLDPITSLATVEGLGTLVMGPTDLAITRASFGDGFLGRQPVEATVTNLTDKPIDAKVKVGPISPGQWFEGPHAGGPALGTAGKFTRELRLGPRESQSIEGAIDVTVHRSANKILVTAEGGTAGKPAWEHWFTGRAKLGLHLHRASLPVGSPWLDAYLGSDLPATEAEELTAELSLRDESGKEIGPSGRAPLAGGRREIGFALPTLPPGRHVFHGRLLTKAGAEIAATSVPFTIDPPTEAGPPQSGSTGKTGSVALELRELAGSATEHWPLTFGVPFPEGLVGSAGDLRLVDADGRPVPASIRTAGRWRKSGTLKWAHVDIPATIAASGTLPLSLRHGSGESGGNPRGRFQVEQRDGTVVVTTGPLRFSGRQGTGSIIDRVWIDADADGVFTKGEAVVQPGGGLVATLTHENGKVYTANLTAGGGLTVEESGPASALLKAEGWFELPREHGSPVSERLCKYVIRVRAVEGSPHLQLSHTFIFTGESKTTRLADIAVATTLAGEGRNIDFGVEGLHVAKGERHLSLVQHADDGFVVFRTSEGFGKPIVSGTRAAGYASLATDRGEVLAGVRDFWQLYPKEFEIADDRLVVHIWPAHGKPQRPVSALTDETVPLLPWVHEGNVLDFQTPESYRSYVMKHPLQAGEADCFTIESFNANALGVAKTHEITLSFAGADRSAATRAAIGRTIQEPPVCAASPEWMCDTAAFGAVKLQPVDRGRLPRIEAAIEGQFDAESRLTERVRAYGMFNYLDAHTWYSFPLGRLQWWRAWANTHHGGPRVAWLLYARSGEPKYLRAAHRRATHHMDLDVVHHDQPYVRNLVYPHGKLRGALNDYKGLVHWNSGTRLYDYNSMADYLFYDWYLTGNRRGLDTAMLFGDAILATPPTAARGTDRLGAGVISALCSLYEETGDERFRPYFEHAGKKMLSGQQPDGFFSTFWTTYAPWRGQYVRATDGDPAAIDSLRRWCDTVVDWRDCGVDGAVAMRPVNHEAYLDTFPMAEDLASGWFLAGGNPDYLRLGLGDLESFAWGMHEGQEHPEYRGFNGTWGIAITLNDYVLQTAPYLLRALAEHGKPVEPLYRRSKYSSAEGVTAYLDLPKAAVVEVFAMIHLQPDGVYELRLSSPGGESLPAVPVAVEAKQPQAVRWKSPVPLAAGEWKLVLAGRKPTTLTRLDVGGAKRITYRLPADATAMFRTPALWFLAPEKPGMITWRFKSQLGDPNGGVLVDPDGHWAGRTTWLDLDAEKWHELTAEVKPTQTAKPWLIGIQQHRIGLVPSANVPRFFAYDREQLFLPQRP